MTSALVLGGGGVAGIAWEAGIIDGLGTDLLSPASWLPAFAAGREQAKRIAPAS